MRLTFTLSLGFLMLCQVLSAAPCMTGTLQSYIDLGAGGCTLAGATFANFTYAPTTVTGVPAKDITVTPTAIPHSPALAFSSMDWHVAAGQSQDSLIKYTVTAVLSSTQSDAFKLQLGTAKVFGIIGSVTVDETVANGELVGALSVFLRCAELCSEKASDQLTFTAMSAVTSVTEHLTLTGGNGGASLDKFTSTFNFCPLCV
jgi:hypothetical protein